MDNMQSALLAGLPGLGLSLPNGAAETMCAFSHALLEKNVLLRELYKYDTLDENQVCEELLAIAPRITPYLKDASSEIQKAQAAGQDILFEGAQGIHLDIDHGTYPFVTSSSTVASSAAAGSGVGPSALERVVGIVKAYTTRVGSGP